MLHSMNNGPTVRDVAAHANVSVGTVSRYLNGYKLRPVTHEKVAAAIDETGYQHARDTGPSARVQTRTIGAVFPRFDDFHVSVLSSLDKILFREGYHMVTCEYEGNEDDMRDKLRLLRDRYADGIVCSPMTSSYGLHREVVSSGIPVVTYNNQVQHWQTDHVRVDDRQAARKAVEYFINLGHRNIAIISGTSRSTTGFDRLAGYRDALECAGIAERPDLQMLDDWGLSEHHAYDATRRLLSMPSPPTAIFAAHGRVGIGALRYVRESGRRIPDDVSLICFDDCELFQLHHPAITAVRQAAAVIASEVCDLLFRRMTGSADDGPITRVIPTELILRDSVARIGA